MINKAILCVDDEKAVLDSIREQLIKRFDNRYVYEVAESADEAWEVIEELNQKKIDLLIIVTDWLMPGIKGDEFLIQVHQRFPLVITVMLTGQADEASIKRAKEQANLYRCLGKPWSEDELIETIEQAWSIYEKTRDSLRG